jgi:hypothetical protein
MLRDIMLQQPGIVNLDVGVRQQINGKTTDFSTAITTPHFSMTLELNPHLTPEMKELLELEIFKRSIGDFGKFERMISDWNLKHAE